MILVLETNAAYLVQPEAKSRAAGWFVLTNKPSASIKANDPIHVICSTIKNVVASTAKAEIVSLYLGCQRACPMRELLAELEHPQPPNGTPVFTDNRTAKRIIPALRRQKLSKAFDMRCYWIKDLIKQNSRPCYESSNFVEIKQDIKTCIRSNICNNCRNKLHEMSSSNTRYDLSMLMSTYKFAFMQIVLLLFDHRPPWYALVKMTEDELVEE